ncbi:hypothetical protein DL771_003027 [Monosporascus sp. 5C6A]|nr:hypothetical protein DL771_003027 [Monosporascus sp. 5C6A]
MARKKLLNRETLEESSIFFFEEKGKYGHVPAHVSSLRDALLDFECTLSARLSFYDEHEFEDQEMLRSVLPKLPVSESEHPSIVHSIEAYRRMRQDAQRLDSGCDREAEWVKFYEKNFLDKLCEEFVITDQDSRRVARTKFYYDDFDVAKERPWSLFSGPGDFREEYGKSNLTTPTPDWVAYFRVYDLKSSWDRIPNSSRQWPWANLAKNKIVENFSLTTLQELAEHGLQFSVTNILRGNRNSSIVLSDLLCYPWLITEYKRKDEQKKVQCYCQAANAGAASLMLLQTLVRHSTYKTVLPIVTMTTWGPKVRIWICFFDDSQKRYNMVCIWEGDMTRTVHMIELHAILENTHTWAMRVLRPWISHHIDQWKSFCHIEHSREQEESVGNDLIDQFGALVAANPLPKIVDELQDGISVDRMESSELMMLFKEQNSLLLAGIRELLGTQRAVSNTERSNKRPSSETQSISTQTDDNLEIDPLYSLRDLFRLPQIESSDEIWSSSRAKSPVPRRRNWPKFDSPIWSAISHHASSSMIGGVYDGYPYFTYEKGELLDILGRRDKWYLARRGIGCDSPKGWVWAADTRMLFNAERDRWLETNGSRIHKPGPTNSLTEANQAPGLIKSDTHVLEKGPPSPAFQRSQATASFETKEAGRHNPGLASVATDDVSIRREWVTCERTGRRIPIKLPNPPVKEHRLSTELFAHPPKAAYSFTGTALPGSKHEDGPPPVRPPDLASFSKEPSTSAAEHGSETDVSADQSQSQPPENRKEAGLLEQLERRYSKGGLFEQSNRGDFKSGLFAGLDTNGWKPGSIPNRNEERQLFGDAGPSKPTWGELFDSCPSSSSSQQKGSRPSDDSEAPVKASLSDGVKTGAPTTPRLFGNSTAFKNPQDNSVSDEKQTSTFKIGLFRGLPSSDPYTRSKPRLFGDFRSNICPTEDDVAAEEPLRGTGHTKPEAPLQPESCISGEEDWETADEE